MNRSENSKVIQNTIDRLLEKSQEAFIMAVEIYNRPSIKYRVEGFSFFICNAWELMIKAKIIKENGYKKLFYINRNGEQRTITLKKALQLTLSNKKSPVVKNLNSIIELRNTSTHFIVEEDNQIYLGLFQACISNYEQYMNTWHQRRIADIFPSNYLTLSINARSFAVKDISAKYPDDVALALLSRKNNISTLEEMSTSPHYSHIIKQEVVLTKNATGNARKIAVVPLEDADEKTAIIRKITDPSKTHPYSTTECIDEINKKLLKNKVTLFVGGEPKDKFTSNDFQLFADQYGYKGNDEYCYVHVVGRNKSRTYSEIVVNQIVDMLTKNNKMIEELKDIKRKRAAQGAKEF